ncbi:MAG: PHP domain-containing protein [Gammaproteobacteria bacterium]|nr:PHP domain-containing protein [Gammaproteobacteria bacterium]
MNIDLHTHTIASDGSLTTNELIQRAVNSGINVLSITDHDTTSAYQQLPAIPPQSLTIIPGIEFSTQWQKTDIHVLGLNIQIHNDAICTGIALQRQARMERAERIAEKLEKLGIENPLSGAQDIAHHNNIGRPHFARHLVKIGATSDINQAFKKYLSAGKPAYFRQQWSPLFQIIDWIRSAGGIATLAHPAKYKLTRAKLYALADEFCALGGEAIEVISGKQIPATTRDLTKLCQHKALLASCGSDFHQPGQSWTELGQYPRLPKACKPIWDKW